MQKSWKDEEIHNIAEAQKQKYDLDWKVNNRNTIRVPNCEQLKSRG